MPPWDSRQAWQGHAHTDPGSCANVLACTGHASWYDFRFSRQPAPWEPADRCFGEVLSQSALAHAVHPAPEMSCANQHSCFQHCRQDDLSQGAVGAYCVGTHALPERMARGTTPCTLPRGSQVWHHACCSGGTCTSMVKGRTSKEMISVNIACSRQLCCTDTLHRELRARLTH